MALKKKGVVVGLGSIGRRHARLLSERDDVELSVCETSDEMLRLGLEEVGQVNIYRDFADVLSTSADFLLIATPHDLHRSQSVAALDRGVHVLCEKPMSHRLEDARAMKAAADASSAILSIAYMLHFNPGFSRMKEAIESGTIGQVLAVNYRVGSYVTLVNSRSRYQSMMRGALLLDYAHQPDLIFWLLSARPRGVYCASARGGEMEFSSDPNVVTLVCDFDTPLVATVTLNYLQMPERHECEVIGDKGWLSFDLKSGEFRTGLRDGKSMTVENFAAERDEMYRQEHTAFINAIDGKSKPSSPPGEAIVSMEIIDAAFRSIDCGTRVELGGTSA